MRQKDKATRVKRIRQNFTKRKGKGQKDLAKGEINMREKETKGEINMKQKEIHIVVLLV